MASFKMNPNFERELKRDLQQKLTKVFNRHKGGSVDDYKAALKREGLEEPALSEMATAFSEGREPRVE